MKFQDSVADMSTNNDTHQAILQTLASIPVGHVCTYGMVAKLAGQPGKARYVGYILRNLHSQSTIPWYRVINSQGKSSFSTDSERYHTQLNKLESEGISHQMGKISLSKYLWEG